MTYSGAMRRAESTALEGYKVSKGTIQFPPDDPLPASLVAKLVKTRIEELVKGRR